MEKPKFTVVDGGKNENIPNPDNVPKNLANQPFSPQEKPASNIDTLVSKETIDNDHLTGLLNRRGFENKVKEMIAAYNRDPAKKYDVLALDIDYFKKVNDTYDHAGGDIVLKRAAEVFGEMFRTTDIIARFGGEEFFIILQDVNREELISRLSKGRNDAGPGISFSTTMPNGDKLNVSFSGGLVDFTPGKDDIEDVLKAADKALYISKNSGRNKITIGSL